MNDKHKISLLAVATILGMTVLTACNPPANDQHLQEQAAQATEQAKQGSKEALADARVAAKNAEQAVNDVAAGVKQGSGRQNARPPRSRGSEFGFRRRSNRPARNFRAQGQGDHRPSPLRLLA